MQIEYATVFISGKQLLLYDEPLRETPITQNSTVYVLEKNLSQVQLHFLMEF